MSKQGFTIVELLMALVIIAVGILAWAKTLDGSIKGRAISNDITTASELAASKLEHLSLILQKKDLSSAEETFSKNGVNYLLSWTIIREQNTIASATKIWQINMLVSWNHYGNKTLQYQKIVVGG